MPQPEMTRHHQHYGASQVQQRLSTCPCTKLKRSLVSFVLHLGRDNVYICMRPLIHSGDQTIVVVDRRVRWQRSLASALFILHHMIQVDKGGSGKPTGPPVDGTVSRWAGAFMFSSSGMHSQWLTRQQAERDGIGRSVETDACDATCSTACPDPAAAAAAAVGGLVKQRQAADRLHIVAQQASHHCTTLRSKFTANANGPT